MISKRVPSTGNKKAVACGVDVYVIVTVRLERKEKYQYHSLASKLGQIL